MEGIERLAPQTKEEKELIDKHIEESKIIEREVEEHYHDLKSMHESIIKSIAYYKFGLGGKDIYRGYYSPSLVIGISKFLNELYGAHETYYFERDEDGYLSRYRVTNELRPSEFNDDWYKVYFKKRK